MLKRDHRDVNYNVFDRLTSSNVFEEAMSNINETQPPTELSGLIGASSEDVTRSNQ